MTNAPIRIIVVLAAFTLTGIIATQVYLVNQAANSESQQFDHSVKMALLDVVESVCNVTGVDVPSNNPIDQITNNYFIVRTNSNIDLEALEYHLKAELSKRAINQDFEYGVYDCQSDQMVYGNFISLKSSNEVDVVKSNFPKLQDYDFYFGIYFPSKTSTLFWEMGWWKYTSIATVLIIILFGYSLFIILRQKQLSAVQKDFVNNITHEFKTPLSTLKVAASVIKKSADKEDRISKYAEMIHFETERLESHVNQLLKSALIENGPGVQLEQINLNEKVAEVIKKFNFENVVLSAAKSTIIINSDHYLMETALYNLLDNARKYGGDQTFVSVKILENKAIVDISDTGAGIPTDQQKNVFKKFFRIPSGDIHNVKGFGLGLYVVQKAIKALNGSIILLKSNTFRIKLPLV